MLSVYKDLLKQGYKGHNIVLLGDSAGGGMVPPMALQLQREGAALPAALGMFSPASDLRLRGDTTRTLIAVDPIFPGAGETVTTGKVFDFAAAAYAGSNPSALDDPLASPVVADYATIFPKGSLPPTMIQVGLRETLLSDAVRLYHKMKEAAPAPGHVVISPYEGMWHVFQNVFTLPEAQAATKEMADYFTRALNVQICK
jgi:acetyl esterase/lipase